MTTTTTCQRCHVFNAPGVIPGLTVERANSVLDAKSVLFRRNDFVGAIAVGIVGVALAAHTADSLWKREKHVFLNPRGLIQHVT